MKAISHLLSLALPSLSLALMLLPAPASAQEATSQQTDRTGTKIQQDDTRKEVAPVATHETVAVLPWVFIDGAEGSKRTAREFLSQVLTTGHLEIVPESRVMATSEDYDADESEHGRAMPSPRQLLKLGIKLGVDYVLAPRVDWHSRSIWVSLGPKTKSTCQYLRQKSG